jgi:7,8-dihydropterin-6-yl-methyl-4-(beta-D-ribofuranosyl)aminobenzene 5'-phosphate synthase
MPELSAAFSTSKGTVLVVGCSHSSVEVILDSAKQAGLGKIHLLTGGFHLLPYDRDYLGKLATRLDKEYEVDTIAPCHCTGHLAFSVLKEAYGERYRFFGLGSRIEI